MTQEESPILVERIKQRWIVLPQSEDTITATELKMFLDGYVQCEKDVIEIVRNMTDPQI